MRKAFVLFNLLIAISFSAIAQSSDSSFQEFESQVTQASEGLNQAATLTTLKSEDRKTIRKASESASSLLGHILNHDKLPLSLIHI